MTRRDQATAETVRTQAKHVNGGELACRTAQGRASQFFYQGRKVDAATAIRLGW